MSRAATVIFLAAMARPASAETINDVPPDLRKTAECMVGVLNTMPKFENAGIDISTNDNWVHPVVRYRYPDKAGDKSYIYFEAKPTKPQQPPFFMTVMGGLFAAPDKGPFLWGADIVMPKWREICHVNVNVLTV